MIVRTRFAPSPTGFLHVGNLRTALYAYLIAKQNNGKFILRIEDTDQKRYVEGALEAILNALSWAKINPDEGVVSIGNNQVTQQGDKGPYIQSQRLDTYRKYAEELIENDQAYYCFCTPERLEELRNKQQKNKLPTGYDGCCRNVNLEEAKRRIADGEKHTIRLKMPKEGDTAFNDLIRGEVIFKNELVDDQVLLKADGFPTYHLAVVVDDHLMEISHVIRGEEWLSSTPKHIQLYKYFGWEPPRFAHMSLFLNADRSKLSKRQGDVSVGDYIRKGYLPEAMVNFIAFLGWNPGGEKEMYSLDELIRDFSLEQVSKAGAIFNLEKLDWYNREYLKLLSNEEVANRAKSFFVATDWWQENWLEKLPQAIGLEKERVTTLSELPEVLKFVFIRPEYDGKILIWKKSNVEETKKILQELEGALNNFSVQEWNEESLQTKIGEWIKENGYSNGIVLWPLRVALSGKENSPGPFEIAAVLGKGETIARIKIALGKI
jgi:nondiscriminating glutamyl-tRNA synthetase